MNNEKNHFLDRGTLIALALIMLVWFGWSKFMESKYPAPVPTVPVKEADKSAAAVTPTTTAPAVPTAASSPLNAASTTAKTKTEKLLKFEDKNFSFLISSRGMGLRDVNIKHFKARDEKPIVLGEVTKEYPFATGLVSDGTPVDFDIEQKGEGIFVGRANVSGMSIEKTMRVASDKYSIETEVRVTGDLEAFKGLVTTLSEKMHPAQSGGMFAVAEYQDFFLFHENTSTRKIVSEKDGLSAGEKNVSIASLGAHYFALAIQDRSDLLPRFETSIAPASPIITGRLVYQPISRMESFSLKYTAFAGPKSFDLLATVSENFAKIIDYGMFGVLGKPILWLLKYLYSLFGNWGWAIVVLTIIVRMIVLPFNAYSYKSMKALQKIQPEMNRIKEKYKDKPADAKLQMNQEIMQLMKANKASPVGGCLPTLLQLPVFFALYQVLGQSIELYRVPFIFWIRDLSEKDPFFVLPVLMGITMFMQQKITPTTMDPQQAKIMMWMPVIFSVFMISLPSGLTLYIFVSTLFGILQQYYFMRDKSTAQSRVKEAKA